MAVLTVPHTPDLEFEKPLWEKGLLYIAGVDEAGRGSWAGPVSAGAVILPEDLGLLDTLSGVRDSKQMTPRQRTIWAERIKEVVMAWGVGFASHAEIDTLGIVPATRLAMQRAIQSLDPIPQHLLIDAVKLNEVKISQSSYKKGDARCLSIAAASVLAKTERDLWMVAAAEEYPDYFFERHKGYGTRAHQKALQSLGPCQIHRKSFAPVRVMLENEAGGEREV